MPSSNPGLLSFSGPFSDCSKSRDAELGGRLRDRLDEAAVFLLQRRLEECREELPQAMGFNLLFIGTLILGNCTHGMMLREPR